VAGRLGKLETFNDLIRTRTRYLPACSIVPQPTTLPRAPDSAVTPAQNKWELFLPSPFQPHFLEIHWQQHVCVKWLGLLRRIRESQFQISALTLPELITDIVRDFPQFLRVNCKILSYNRRPALPIESFPNNFTVLGGSSQSLQASTETVPRLGRGLFLPNPSQFISYLSSQRYIT
jgi:hypothetical protein